MFRGTHWGDYLPLLIFVAIMAWRLRSLSRARPLRPAMLWILPVVVSALVGLAIYGTAPGLGGMAALAFGAVLGSGVGAQRARLMRLHVERQGDAMRVMVRSSPAAIIVILAVFGLRRVMMPGYQAALDEPSAGSGLLVVDAMLGLVVGLVVGHRAVLWLRARRLLAGG